MSLKCNIFSLRNKNKNLNYVMIFFFRLYSDYFHTMQFLNASDKASRNGFHQAVVEGLQMYNDCFQRHSLRSCVYNHTIHDKTHVSLRFPCLPSLGRQLLNADSFKILQMLSAMVLFGCNPQIIFVTFSQVEPSHF